MIRLATTEDLPNLLRMSEAFFNSSGYESLTTFDRCDSKQLLIDLISLGTLVTDGKHSMLGFVMFPMFMNKKTIMAQELFWWVDKEKRGSRVGIELLKYSENIAKESGASVMNMLSLAELDGDKVNKLYSRMGYTPKEQSYMRVL